MSALDGFEDTAVSFSSCTVCCIVYRHILTSLRMSCACGSSFVLLLGDEDHPLPAPRKQLASLVRGLSLAEARAAPP